MSTLYRIHVETDPSAQWGREIGGYSRTFTRIAAARRYLRSIPRFNPWVFATIERHTDNGWEIVD